MDSSEAERIFERFYKVDKGRSRAGGAGLGLAIARHLLELHGSQLQVVSEVGRGSRFSFALPLAD
jgi:signal transduction histidine kinase